MKTLKNSFKVKKIQIFGSSISYTNSISYIHSFIPPKFRGGLKIFKSACKGGGVQKNLNYYLGGVWPLGGVSILYGGFWYILLKTFRIIKVSWKLKNFRLRRYFSSFLPMNLSKKT